jgi:hypothetical protein
MKGFGSGSVQIMTDMDPRGKKTYGSGSGTLIKREHIINIVAQKKTTYKVRRVYLTSTAARNELNFTNNYYVAGPLQYYNKML